MNLCRNHLIVSVPGISFSIKPTYPVSGVKPKPPPRRVSTNVLINYKCFSHSHHFLVSPPPLYLSTLTVTECQLQVNTCPLKNQSIDFPGGPVVKTLASKAGGTGLIPSQGTKIPHAV